MTLKIPQETWHSHTNTDTVVLIPVLQHIKSSSKADLGSPCPSSGYLLSLRCAGQTVSMLYWKLV